MSYEFALKAAGAIIHAIEYSGNYQGRWAAKVTYQGKTGWVTDYFGSCSHCDAFESEFDCSGHYIDDDYHSCLDAETLKNECKECLIVEQRLKEFGKNYLETIITQEEMEEMLEKPASWDYDSQKLLKFIKENNENTYSQ